MTEYFVTDCKMSGQWWNLMLQYTFITSREALSNNNNTLLYHGQNQCSKQEEIYLQTNLKLPFITSATLLQSTDTSHYYNTAP